VAVIDPIGGPIGVSVAELLAPDRSVHLVTQDHFAGQMLGLTGDLAPANVRLAQAGVTIEARSVARRLTAAGVEIEHRFTGETSVIAVALVVDAGHRLADEELWTASGRKHVRIGDAVAPRTIHEAILEARRAILDLDI
jgi:2,4-dienoyl-CoA reductase (NADPH2)